MYLLDIPGKTVHNDMSLTFCLTSMSVLMNSSSVFQYLPSSPPPPPPPPLFPPTFQTSTLRVHQKSSHAEGMMRRHATSESKSGSMGQLMAREQWIMEYAHSVEWYSNGVPVWKFRFLRQFSSYKQVLYRGIMYLSIYVCDMSYWTAQHRSGLGELVGEFLQIDTANRACEHVCLYKHTISTVWPSQFSNVKCTLAEWLLEGVGAVDQY